MPSAPDNGRTSEPIVQRLFVLVLALGAILWVAVVVWQSALQTGLAQLAERGRADLRLASDRLVSSMLSFREAAVMTADHPFVVALAQSGEGADPSAVSGVLRQISDLAGAQELMLVDDAGRILASSTERQGMLEPAPDLERAAQGATGSFHLIDRETGERTFRYAAPVFSPGGPVLGAIVLSFDAEKVEAPGRGDPVPVWFVDEDGVVFVANRSEMVFETVAGARPDSRVYPEGTDLHPGRIRPANLGSGLVRGGAYLPEIGLPVTLPLPTIGMTGHALEDAGPIMRIARAQAVSVALALLGFGAVILALWERRRTLADQLAAEARANAELERRVTERTTELRETNEQLRRTQAELVQAGKMSALGQMSAGISHELNQPLMAIRSFADNAELLLERGRTEEAGQTLGRISEMARRMGRIIKNLRAFARAETEPASRVGLASVVEQALELLEARIAQEHVTIDWQRPEAPAIVMGGEVRLAQVVVNLLSNAIDAMEGQERKRITIRIHPEGARTVLTLQDTGPGIAEPDRIFDPFYSTKEVGSAEGMGLGLSISYGLVQGFGGTLSGGNAPEGGAIFTVALRAAPQPGNGGKV